MAAEKQGEARESVLGLVVQPLPETGDRLADRGVVGAICNGREGEKKEVGDSDDLEVRSASSSLSGNREWLRLGRTIGDVVSGSGVIALAKEEGELSVGKLQCQRKQEKERGIANWWREAWHRWFGRWLTKT
ncbi:hypothetical protein BHM03_00021051 [Ensete ventricosum]|nr:hypothetical protein BHM03_00021051 [Ensete ventricosum]